VGDWTIEVKTYNFQRREKEKRELNPKNRTSKELRSTLKKDGKRQERKGVGGRGGGGAKLKGKAQVSEQLHVLGSRERKSGENSPEERVGERENSRRRKHRDETVR